MELKLYDTMRLMENNGLDVKDNTFDYCCYFYAPKDNEEEDQYDKIMNYFAHNITCLYNKEDLRLTCKITEFIVEHKKAFDNFIKNNYSTSRIPQSFNIDSESKEFYDLYFKLFSNIIYDNLCSWDYEELYEELTKRRRARRD